MIELTIKLECIMDWNNIFILLTAWTNNFEIICSSVYFYAIWKGGGGSL